MISTRTVRAKIKFTKYKEREEKNYGEQIKKYELGTVR